MNKAVFALAAIGLATLGGCGGASIDGKWCPVGQAGSVTFQGGKATVTDGSSTETGTYTFDGKVVTAKQDGPDGVTNVLTLVEDGSLVSGEGPFALTFKRCPS